MTSPIGRGAPKFTQFTVRNMGLLAGRVVRQTAVNSNKTEELYLFAIKAGALIGGLCGTAEGLNSSNRNDSLLSKEIDGFSGCILGTLTGALAVGALPLTILIAGAHLINKKT